MPDVSKIELPKFETCQEVGCKYHRKESRYVVRYFQRLNLVIVKCLECKPHTEVCRFKITTGEN